MSGNQNGIWVRSAPAKTNLQRQREFCARNPHYYRDRARRKKAQSEARAKLMAQHPELTFEEAYAISIGKAPAPAKVQPAQQPETPPVVLALPAPEEVVTQMVTITLPECFVYAPAKIKVVTEPMSLERRVAGDESAKPRNGKDG